MAEPGGHFTFACGTIRLRRLAGAAALVAGAVMNPCTSQANQGRAASPVVKAPLSAAHVGAKKKSGATPPAGREHHAGQHRGPAIAGALHHGAAVARGGASTRR
jgi:hypothetical protein